MRKYCIPYIPCRSLLLSTTVLNDIAIMGNEGKKGKKGNRVTQKSSPKPLQAGSSFFIIHYIPDCFIRVC